MGYGCVHLTLPGVLVVGFSCTGWEICAGKVKKRMQILL